VERLLNLPEVARQLGITERGVREKIWRKELPFVRVGKLVRIPETELSQFMKALRGISANEAFANLQAANPTVE
jgi:excisionase family DNA binding protein